jgi:MYXO-CTERM domain-containing protein
MRRIAITLILAATLVTARPAHAALGDNDVGMNLHIGDQSFVDAAVDLGATWVRLDANWWVLEPSQGVQDWAALDDGVTRCRDAGLKVFLTLAYTPSWVARHGDTDAWSGNDVPDGSTEWTDFVSDAVTRYRALGVTHFGLWNEANLGGFWEGSAAEYVSTILVPGAAAVRDACADCLVLGPDLASVGEWDDWLDEMLSSTPLGTFDVFTHHSYNGFEETGVQVWDNDRFFNVLDQQRFAFTRRDLRQLLDDWGYAGEVWITETGYEADPPGNAGEEDLQAIYVVRVLEEQLLRGWYTASFFYEMADCGIDQPGCTIDGFGLLRATGGTAGSRTFPDDYRLKPAFQAIKDFIDAHPEFGSVAPPAACGDGVDNDGDGFIDSDDRGCADGLDADEGDDPPRPALVATPGVAVTIDGDHADLGAEGWISLTAADWRGTEPLSGAGDLAVRAAARWEAGALVLAFEVTDDVQENDHADPDLWQGDSVQLGFDVAESGGTGYDAVDDHEINVALVGGQARTYRFHGPAGASDAVEAAVIRSGTITRYEMRLPAAVLPGITWAAGTRVGFSFLVNDADGAGRVGWSEWTPGIGTGKTPYYFGEIRLVDQGTPGPDAGPGVDAGPGNDAGPGVDGATGGDAGPGADGGTPPGDGTSGCGCASAPGAGDGLVALLLLGLVSRRRRRPGVR